MLRRRFRKAFLTTSGRYLDTRDPLSERTFVSTTGDDSWRVSIYHSSLRLKVIGRESLLFRNIANKLDRVVKQGIVPPREIDRRRTKEAI